MIVQCKSCSKKFVVKEEDIPQKGRSVQCGYCSVIWHQMPILKGSKSTAKLETPDRILENNESPSIDSIKGSDGKTYKFLGSQWAQLLPSGKTGLFAKKKISKELDKITGRITKRITKKRKRKIEEVDPSSGMLNPEKKLPDLYKPKQGLGFFGYVFLIIVIGFSVVGVLQTFEDDLLNYFPESSLIFELLEEQLEFLAESVKNIIILVDDLINSY